MSLYPFETETREAKDLSGIWNFRPDSKGVGRKEKWHLGQWSESQMMAVPSSYNDVSQDVALRDHVGDVWYQRPVFVPASWKGDRVYLRVDAACHRGTVWLNGKEITSHKGGYLPFEADITESANYGGENKLVICVNNILDYTILPPGEIKTEKHAWGTITWQDIQHDFFNYAGLHRPVRLCRVPATYIADITTVPSVQGTTGSLKCSIETSGSTPHTVEWTARDHTGNTVATGSGANATLKILKARLWEPGNAYLYTLEAKLVSKAGVLLDVYRFPVGIRTVQIKGKRFYINGKPFYFKGFGKHEDASIRGKALDHALNVKDFNLMRWIGANSARTSHYPYSEEFMQMADRDGLVVIDESPAVGLQFFGKTTKFFIPEKGGNPELLRHHIEVMQDLIRRDKNYACVVMWSVQNEAGTDEEGSRPYFQAVIEATRKADPCKRPVTGVVCTTPTTDITCDLYDVVCVNRYHGWYWHPGRWTMIAPSMIAELKAWYKNFKKPVIITEYGADTVEGLHMDPPVIFSEEYQIKFLDCNHEAFDACDFVIGEHVWNFADFATKQGITRVNGNRKGVFTRERQPKSAAFALKKRWSDPSFDERMAAKK